jgi:hypothetical protein
MVARQQDAHDARGSSNSRADGDPCSAAIIRSSAYYRSNGSRSRDGTNLYPRRGRAALARNQLRPNRYLRAVGQCQAGQLEAQSRTVSGMRFLRFGHAAVNRCETLRDYHAIHYHGL